MKPTTALQDSLSRLLSGLESSWKNLSRRFRILNHDFSEKMGTPAMKSHFVAVFFMSFILFAGYGVIATVMTMEIVEDQADHQELCTSAFSTWMAESLISRQQGIMTDLDNAAQPLQAGVTQKALTAVLDRYPENKLIRDYLHRSTKTVAPFLSGTVADVKNWPLDRLSNGNAMIQNGSSTYNKALEALVGSIAANQRNNENGLWYWQNYPEWSYLDGMYSFAPFSALFNFNKHCSETSKQEPYSSCTPINDTMNDIFLQFSLLWKHCRNSTTGLLHHGYDASKKATWAGRATGSSPIVWGRSLGWYAMALVDTLELLPADTTTPWRDPLLEYFQELTFSIMESVDNLSGGWFQVVDQSGRKGNYIESSATAMFSYALLKGARLGYVGEKNVLMARSIGSRAHHYLTEAFVVREENGTLGWNGTVGVCSLNSSATYEYYVSQPIDYNNPFGAGAYILASVEAETLENATPNGNGTVCS
ncbi:hypothetical protein VMCG_04915 [Cytospora schulzeri]|uniref:Glycosyl hydrolase family 88 n=1 Tax=Cytospora schulzeri TaxID=448051 RepID=A0A423WMR8_9PEZI|nr:hypothetical protein VMCG_04915 [Valsa malicola]